MNPQKFSLILPYEGKMVIAEVQEVSNINHYSVKFPDGYENTFHTFEGAENSGWAEVDLGFTQVGKDVGRALDEYRLNKNFIEPFALDIQGKEILVQPISGDTLTYFTIYIEGKFGFALKMNDDGLWVADYEEPFSEDMRVDENFVRAIGQAIEHHDL